MDDEGKDGRANVRLLVGTESVVEVSCGEGGVFLLLIVCCVFVFLGASVLEFW